MDFFSLNFRTKHVLFFCAFLLLTSCHDNRRDAIGQTEVLIETTEGDIVVRLYDDTPLHRDNFIRQAEAGRFDGIPFNRIVPEMVIQAGVMGEEAPTVPAEIVYPRHFHKQGALAAAREADSINPGRASSALHWYIVTGRTYSAAQLSELHATLYEARIAALFEQLQRTHATELETLKSSDRAAQQELLNRLQVEAEEATAKNPPRPFSEAQKQTYANIGGAPHLDGEYTVFGEVVEGLDIVKAIDWVDTDPSDRPLTDVRILHATVVK